MEMKQISTMLNNAFGSLTGAGAIVQEDLSNIVDFGKDVFDNTDVNKIMTSGVGSMLNQIGKMIFVDRVYRGTAPSVLMDGWEFGSILAKVTTTIPKYEENPSWKLEDGQSYDPHIFYAAQAEVKFYNQRTTFEINRSITEIQLRQAFTSAEQMSGFVAMLYTQVENGLTVATDALIHRTICAMIAETVYADYENAAITSKSGTKAVNLLKLYNDRNETALTIADAMSNGDFIRFASREISLYSTRMRALSQLYNINGKDRFTPVDLQKFVVLGDFATAAQYYLYDGNGQFRDEYIKLPEGDVVPYWQGFGATGELTDVSTVDVQTPAGHDVKVTGVLAVLFDRDALGVANFDRRVHTEFNPVGEFTNYFYKQDAGYFADANENFVVFFAA